METENPATFSKRKRNHDTSEFPERKSEPQRQNQPSGSRTNQTPREWRGRQDGHSSRDFRKLKQKGRRGNLSLQLDEATTGHEEEVPNEEPSKTQKKPLYQYGNYPGYYNYRNKPDSEDPRLQYLDPAIFEGKDVLDIGCNDGRLTLAMAHKFRCKSMLGLDIDDKLIARARRFLQSLKVSDLAKSYDEFPISFALTFGPIPREVLEKFSMVKPVPMVSSIPSNAACDGESASPPEPLSSKFSRFPHNVLFRHGNFVEVEEPDQKFDVILCLSLTKWVHLNWGDVGLKRLFRKMYASLNKGGLLILEPQTWKSYEKKGNMTPNMKKTMKEIKLKPDMFEEYLQQDIGFQSPKVVQIKSETSEGFSRPLYFFRK